MLQTGELAPRFASIDAKLGVPPSGLLAYPTLLEHTSGRGTRWERGGKGGLRFVLLEVENLRNVEHRWNPVEANVRVRFERPPVLGRFGSKTIFDKRLGAFAAHDLSKS